MRFPNDTAFHLRMAAFLIGAMLLESLAERSLPGWTSPRIGMLAFLLGLTWVFLYAFHVTRVLQRRVLDLEQRLERTNDLCDALADERRQRRALPPL
ncbi:MAG: hypothetical protein U1E73_12205 [Planctomycetota bacterium]